MDARIDDYFTSLSELGRGAECTQADGNPVSLGTVFAWASERMHAAHADGKKVMFVGNGGSAAIASHMAIDYAKNGGIRALALNDPAALTCLGNDYGYEHVFSKQVEFHGAANDMVVAISSSGQSANIRSAVVAARAKGCSVLTLSGFESDNPLRRSGDHNIYVASRSYGFVEVTHLALCHALLDIAICGDAADIRGKIQQAGQ